MAEFANRQEPLRLPDAEMLVEVDDLRALLKPDDDTEVAGSAAAQRDDFLDMIGHPGPPRIGRDRDMDGERPLAGNRLVASGYRHEILQVDAVRLAGSRAALADDDHIESGAYRIRAAVAFRRSEERRVGKEG